ncbi:hypothetical protein [Citrobacter freundii]|uniref:hypothetical protein n=1 Tax=Citrobacter freundii TaxID=546 RepID=UPI0027E568EA|nr:hypothetical protein [Citrobacter freundii]
MHANGGAIDSKLQPEAALIAIEKGGNADQKGDDTYALGQPIRGHASNPNSILYAG